MHLAFKLVCRQSTQAQIQTNNDRADSRLLIVFENGARFLAVYRENNAIPQEQNLFMVVTCKANIAYSIHVRVLCQVK